MTNRRKLFDSNGRLNASFCVLSSLALPSPPLFTDPGNFGKLGGNSDDKSRSETLVESEEVGTLNFFVAGWAEPVEGGGKDGRCVLGGRGLSCAWESWAGGAMGCPDDGTGM